MNEIAGVHEPECNAGCWGDAHYLLVDPPRTVEEVRAMVER